MQRKRAFAASCGAYFSDLLCTLAPLGQGWASTRSAHAPKTPAGSGTWQRRKSWKCSLQAVQEDASASVGAGFCQRFRLVNLGQEGPKNKSFVVRRAMKTEEEALLGRQHVVFVDGSSSSGGCCARCCGCCCCSFFPLRE